MKTKIISMLNPTLKVFRVPSGPPALRDMTNMTNLEAIPRFTRSRHPNRDTVNHNIERIAQATKL